MSTRTVVTVAGMTCGHCASAVRQELAAVPGITGVEVDLASGVVTVDAHGPVDAAALAAAVDEAGYQVVP